eukprot:CAMPEP_0115644594 /NCGR_PEP_ID=MMETSP0272-20121206/37968_1 /TAXON_ID=71861 /ORGANISM="Scrippsiella trochoidea, Strain CCMP3099" /LENGTH=63 /DNA_ID=CAMNT_0003082041 /DNA_START=360 /DNA_END=548 /DNA_ORIENTATION=+
MSSILHSLSSQTPSALHDWAEQLLPATACCSRTKPNVVASKSILAPTAIGGKARNAPAGSECA